MSLEDIQTSKNILTPDYIETAIEKLSAHAYEELYVCVDFAFESEECSFGTDPEDPLYVADIEIGEDLSLEEQYYALLHELGHAILYIDDSQYGDTLLLEILAWAEGLKVANKLGLMVNERQFREQMIYAINLYQKEAKNDN